jgi:hypothetical protein
MTELTFNEIPQAVSQLHDELLCLKELLAVVRGICKIP